MEISRIQIANYRSIKNIDLCIEDYVALIGVNGAGKSSAIYALKWFYDGLGMSEDDIHLRTRSILELDDMHEPEVVEKEDIPQLEVIVTFINITPSDKARLGRYGKGSEIVLKRVREGSTSRFLASGISGPGFNAIRENSQATAYLLYCGVRTEISELAVFPKSVTKTVMDAELTRWETDPNNKEKLVTGWGDSYGPSDCASAPNAYSSLSEAFLACSHFVFIPAGTDMASQVSKDTTGSLLSQLIGGITKAAENEASEAWLAANPDAFTNYRDSVTASIESSTAQKSIIINEEMKKFVPGIELSLIPVIPPWVPKIGHTLATRVKVNGLVTDVSKQGHGVQRAISMAMIQASGSEIAAGSKGELWSAARVICIEEPEIYQHPVRARAFASTLASLSKKEDTQVVLATHSPYFIRSDQFSKLRRFTLKDGETNVKSTTIEEVSQVTGKPAKKIIKEMERTFPTAFSEGFFAEMVVIVEGPTDKAVIESIVEKFGLSLDSFGVSVLAAEGKPGLFMPFTILNNLGIPLYVVFDGDNDPDEASKDAHRKQTNEILAWLPESEHVLTGGNPYAFGDPTIITENYTIWGDDLEAELALWPSYQKSSLRISPQGMSKDIIGYKAAIKGADLDDIPDGLKGLFAAILLRVQADF